MKPTYKKDHESVEGFTHGGRLVCGTSGLGGVWGNVKSEESVDTILYALEHGISAFDTSPSYANAEVYLGKAFRQWQGERPFISTKIGRKKAQTAFDCHTDYSTSGLEKSLHTSLRDLSVDKVDLLFLHEPHLVPLREMDRILKVLNQFKSDGLCDMIGVGGNPSAEFWPFVKRENFSVISGFLKMNACNLTAFDSDMPVVKKEGLLYYAASPLHFGLLGNKFHQYITGQLSGDWLSADDMKNARRLNSLAEQNDMSLSALANRYLFSVTEADRVVAGATNMEEMKRLLDDWHSGSLDKKLFDEITRISLSSSA